MKKIVLILLSFVLATGLIAIPSLAGQNKAYAEKKEKFITEPVTPFKSFSLNKKGTVKARWDGSAKTLTISGNGKINPKKWNQLKKKCTSDPGWGSDGRYFKTKLIIESGVKLPDYLVAVDHEFDAWYDGLFEDLRGEIHISDDLDTSSMTTMENMFARFKGKLEVNFDNWDTSKVESMAYMFTGYEGNRLKFPNWDTSNVRCMINMFADYQGGSLEIPAWNTRNLELGGEYGMFEGIRLKAGQKLTVKRIPGSDNSNKKAADEAVLNFQYSLAACRPMMLDSYSLEGELKKKNVSPAGQCRFYDKDRDFWHGWGPYNLRRDRGYVARPIYLHDVKKPSVKWGMTSLNASWKFDKKDQYSGYLLVLIAKKKDDGIRIIRTFVDDISRNQVTIDKMTKNLREEAPYSQGKAEFYILPYKKIGDFTVMRAERPSKAKKVIVSKLCRVKVSRGKKGANIKITTPKVKKSITKGYTIYRQTYPSKKYVKLGYISAKKDAVTFVDKKAKNANKYKYVVKPFLKGKRSFYGSYGRKTFVKGHAQPVVRVKRYFRQMKIEARRVKRVGIAISWKKQPNVSGYKVYRKDPGQKKYTVIKDFGRKKTKFVNTSSILKKGKKYYYRVRPYRKMSNGKILYGPFSKPASAYAK